MFRPARHSDIERRSGDRPSGWTFAWCWTAALAALVVGLVLCLATSVSAQRRGRRDRRGYDRRWMELPERDIFPSDCFTFCRVQYNSGWGDRGRGGGDWETDRPDSDSNFSIRLAELTTINVNRNERGEVKYAVVRLTDDDLFNYPFIYMLEVGNLMFSDKEAERLRQADITHRAEIEASINMQLHSIIGNCTVTDMVVDEIKDSKIDYLRIQY